METVYVRINWQNQPSTATALGATNLNKIDLALSIIDGRVVAINTTKLDVSVANTLVQDVTVDDNGVFTIKKLDGSTTKYDTKLEKIAVNFTYDSATQKIVITLDDGTKQYVDLSSLITEYEFTDSSTIGFTVTDGKVSASVKNGSITAEKLQPNYLADITVQQQTATAQAKLAKRYAVGGVEAGDTTDNAKYYKEQAELFKTQAKQYRDEAQDISNVGIAGESKLGLVKGDGNVEIESDGDMWADPYKDKGTVTGTFINFKSADDAMAQVNIKGATTVVPTNPDLPISPDNKATLVSAQNFDLVSFGINHIPKTTKQGVTTKGITFTPNTDGTITLSGTSTSTTTDFYLYGYWGDNNTKFTLRKGTYILHGSGNAGVQIYLGYGSDLVAQTAESNRRIDITKDTPVSFIFIRVLNGVTVENVIVKPMMHLGLESTPYIQYKEDRINIPYELGEWNDIKDGSYAKGGNEYIFTGQETWVKSSAPAVINVVDRYILSNTGSILDSKRASKGFCTHFKYAENNNTVVKYEMTIDANNNLYINFSDYGTTTVEQFKAFLADQYAKGTPVKIRYELANPVITPLNTYLKTFKGVTNIFTNATPQPEITATFKPQLWADLYNHQNAINSKIDDKKRVNNLLSTDPTTVLSGSMGKQLKDEIDAMNNNMPKQINYWSDTQKNLLAKINDVSDPTFRTVIINGWDSVFTDSDMPYRNTVWHIAIYNNGRDINVWQRWTNLDNGSIYMRLYNPSSSSWGNWINNDLKSVTYTGITESYATPNGKYAYLALPVAKDSAKNLLVNVVNDEYIVHATYHNAYNWLALITKVDDSVPLSTSLTVNYTLIN